MKKKTIIILCLSLIILLSLIFVYFTNKSDNGNSSNQNNLDNDDDESENPNPDGTTDESITPVITVQIDRYNKTITIISVENGTDLLWSNVQIVNGTASLPDGTIDEGDIITDCIGFLDFKWIPTNEVFLHCEFVRE